MSLFAIAFELRQVEIDDDAFDRAIDDAEANNLPEIGREIDEVATASLRFRGRTSRPGETPTAHKTGRSSLRNIQAAYLARENAVIAGPAGLPSKRLAGGRTVPQELEFGIRNAARPLMAPTLRRVAKGRSLREVWRNSIGGRR